VDSEARPNGIRPDRCLIPDLRGVALGQLAIQVAAGENEVTGVVSRIVESRESPSGVAVMMFNNSI
jgi:FXSXX-COOH protein